MSKCSRSETRSANYPLEMTDDEQRQDEGKRNSPKQKYTLFILP